MADQPLSLVVIAVDLGFQLKDAYDLVKENDASRNEMVNRIVRLLEQLENLAQSLPDVKGEPHAPGMRMAVRNLQSELRDAFAKLDFLAPSRKGGALDKIVRPVKNLITAHEVDSALSAVERQVEFCLDEFTATQVIRDGIALGHLDDRIDKLEKKVTPSQAQGKKFAHAGGVKGKVTDSKLSPNPKPAKKAAPAQGKSPTSDVKQSKHPKAESKPPASSKPSPEMNAGKKPVEKKENSSKVENKPSPRPSAKPTAEDRKGKDDTKTGSDKTGAGRPMREGPSKWKWSGKGKESATAGKGKSNSSTPSKPSTNKPHQQSDRGKASSSDATFPSKVPRPAISIRPAALARQISESSAISTSSASSGSSTLSFLFTSSSEDWSS